MDGCPGSKRSSTLAHSVFQGSVAVATERQNSVGTMSKTDPQSIGMPSAFLGDPMIAIMPLVTQIWSCVMCPWEGENPTLYMLKTFDRMEVLPRDPIPWPTCPNCGEHRFYVDPVGGASSS